MKRVLLLCIAGVFAVGLARCTGCGPSPSGPGADGGIVDDGGVMTNCTPLGDSCGSGDPCCQGACTFAGVCELLTVTCTDQGNACADNTDCCTKRCEGGVCSGSQCIDNGRTCSSNSQCCTGNCAGGTCAAVPGAGLCRVEGQTCGADLDCCSTNCQGGICAAAYTCRAPNDLCYKDSDCCSLLCSQNDGKAGFCRLPPGGCTQDGVPCSGSSTCCTRICADPGTGASVCLPASGCKMTGAPCPEAQSCCGGGSNPNGSVQCVKLVETDTYGRCDNGQSCNPVGNICGAKFPTVDGGTFTVNASQNCCDGKTEVCKLDSSGIPRCFGGGSVQCPNGYTGVEPCCIQIGQICQFKDQCCNGAPCVPDQAGVLRCTGSSCTPLGSECTPGSDGGNPCCAGECLPHELGSVCRIPPTPGDGGTPADGGTPGGDGGTPADGGTSDAGTPCKVNGSTCTTGSECCSTLCDNGVCAVPKACQPKDGVCTTSADCCTGLACSIPSGAQSGTCQPAGCANAGQSCSPTNPCCTNLLCLKDGTTNPEMCDGTTSCTCNVILN